MAEKLITDLALQERHGRVVDLVAIEIPSHMLEFTKNRMGLDGKVRLEMPRELLVAICQEADGVYF